jgi:IMP cyclohydrolase
MTNISEMAARNFENHLRLNAYPGRGLVIGRSAYEPAWLMLYWIMGRSEHSRNRRFVVEDGTLKTEPVDASRVNDPALIIYEAMLELPGLYLVSNGDQTRTLYDMLIAGGTFEAAMAMREREPDAPNYTPRISGLLDLRDPMPGIVLSILKANVFNPELTDRFTYRPAPPMAGYGLCLTTYAGDGNPLPSFAGDPLPVPLQGSAEEILETYWGALDPANRISLALKRIPVDGGPGEIFVRNRFA